MLIQRDEESAEKEAKFYYSKLPALQNKKVLICDPMIATGGSMLLCLQKIVDSGVAQSDITVIGVIACEEGLRVLNHSFPQIKLVVGTIDPVLNG